VVPKLQVVPEPQEIDATVELPRDLAFDRQPHAANEAGVEVAERVAAFRELVVVARAQTELDGDRQGGRRLSELDARADAELEIRALVLAGVRLAGQLEREDDLRR